jgi:hypothetical protein
MICMSESVNRLVYGICSSRIDRKHRSLAPRGSGVRVVMGCAEVLLGMKP